MIDRSVDTLMRLVIAAVERVIRLWALRGGQLGELELCEQNRAKRKKEGAAWTLADNAWASSTFFFFFLFFKHHIYRVNSLTSSCSHPVYCRSFNLWLPNCQPNYEEKKIKGTKENEQKIIIKKRRKLFLQVHGNEFVVNLSRWHC